MPTPQRILISRYNDYRLNGKKSIYRHLFEPIDIKEGMERVIFNTLCKNIDKPDHPLINRYPAIVSFVKNYKDSYDHAVDLLFNDMADYYQGVIDREAFISLCDPVDTTDHLTMTGQDIVEMVERLNAETIGRLRSNVNILIDRKLSREEVVIELNRRYPLDANPKLNAMHGMSIHLFDLHQRYKPPKFQFKYGQDTAYDIFREKMRLPGYWGLMIAPTGWGKSMMHYLFMGLFFQQSNRNILLLTKRKDILSDVIAEIQGEIRKLKEKRMFPDVEITVCDQVNHKLDHHVINQCTEYSVVIINSDKLITRNLNDAKFNSARLDRLNWDTFGLVIFDEVHWAGAPRNVQFMNYLKSKIPYGIGSSATPIRRSLQNQENIKSLYGETYQIMYELSYMDAWTHRVILKVDTMMFPIYRNNILAAPPQPANRNGDIKTNYTPDVDQETKRLITRRIDELLDISYKKKVIMFFRSRLSLLQWYGYFTSKKRFKGMTYHMSISYSTGSVDVDEEERTTDDMVNQMIERMSLNRQEIRTGIRRFKKQADRAILMVVNRANEGFDDPPVDICINLDFTQNSNMLVTLQRMGRAQRLMGDKLKGYYLCPVLVDDEENFKDLVARSIYNYIDATTNNAIDSHGVAGPRISKEVMTYIIESFRTEGRTDYSHDDLMKRILIYVKERDMTLERFIDILKTYNISDHETYHETWQTDESFRKLGMPRFYNNAFDNFAWNAINQNDHYTEDEIVQRLTDIYEMNTRVFDLLDDHNDVLDRLCCMDCKIPRQFPWLYYNIDESVFSFIYN